MAWTLAQVETEVRRLRQQYAVLNTTEDISNLTALNNTRHQTVLTEIANIKSRLEDLEDAVIALQDNIADHETCIAALE